MDELPEDQGEDQETINRLSRIATQWASLYMAHSGEPRGNMIAKETVLQRYRKPVYRYLLGAVRNADTAEELAQEFAVRFLWGDFRRVDPQRGRFRDYVKTVLINMVRAHHKSQQKQPIQLSTQMAEPAAADDLNTESLFEDYLRLMLLDRAWLALQNAKPKYYSVLKMRSVNPDLPSREMAQRISEEYEMPVTADVIRKTLERARCKFADLLVNEAYVTLQCDDNDQLESELKELRLWTYCREAVDRRGS